MLLALDLANECGYAVFDEYGGLVLSGVLTGKGKNKYKKFITLKNKILDVVKLFKVTEVVIEDVQLQAIFVNGRRVNNVKAYRGLCELRGAICVGLLEAGVNEFFEYTPSEWRAVFKIKQGRGITRDLIKAQIVDKFGEFYENATIDELEAILLGRAHFEKVIK